MNFEIIDIIEDLSNEEYHNREEVSSSFVKTVVKTGSVVAAIEDRDNTKPNQDMLLGSAWHSYLEGKDSFHETVAVFDDSDIMHELMEEYSKPRATKAYKEFKSEFEGNAGGNIVITQDDLIQFEGMYESMKQNRWVMDNILSTPDVGIKDEWSYIWEYEGVAFRTRPDRQICDFMGDVVAVADWKSCRDALRYKKDIEKWRHDISAIMYSIPLDLHPENFYFIATDKSEPYVTKEWGLKKKTIRKAWDDFHKAIRMIKHYQETGEDMSFDKEVDRV